MTPLLALRHGSAGATAMRNSNAMPIGPVMRSKYGRPTESRELLSGLGDERKDRAEQHDEREGGEQQVVHQERGFARDGRVDGAGRAQRVAAPRQQSADDRPR